MNAAAAASIDETVTKLIQQSTCYNVIIIFQNESLRGSCTCI